MLPKQPILEDLQGTHCPERKKFRQLMRKTLKQFDDDYEVVSKSYIILGYMISYNETTHEIEVAQTDYKVTPKDKRDSVAAEANVGGKKKRRKKASKGRISSNYPHDPDPVALETSMKLYMDDPDNGVMLMPRLEQTRSNGCWFTVSLYVLSQVTRDPAKALNLVLSKMERLKVEFDDPDEQEYMFVKPNSFAIGPIKTTNVKSRA